jgi:hypothetical protein
MVINATNINYSMRMAFNDPCVNTRADASIGTLIDERTFLSARGLYRRVHILLLLFEQNNVFSCTWHVAQVKKIIDINVFRCIWHVAQVENIINILVACRGMCHGVQSETDDSKVLKFGCHGKVLPISMNRLAFIIFGEDKCVETTDELLIPMT